MLAALGIDSVERLFDDIPAAVRATGWTLPAAAIRAGGQSRAGRAGRAATASTWSPSWAPASTATTSRLPSTPSSRGASSPRRTRPTSPRSARARCRPSTSSSRSSPSSWVCPSSRLRTTTAPRPRPRQRSWPCVPPAATGCSSVGPCTAMRWKRPVPTSLRAADSWRSCRPQPMARRTWLPWKVPWPIPSSRWRASSSASPTPSGCWSP